MLRPCGTLVCRIAASLRLLLGLPPSRGAFLGERPPPLSFALKPLRSAPAGWEPGGILIFGSLLVAAGSSVQLGRCRTPRSTISSRRPTPEPPRLTRSRPAPSARTDTSSSRVARARYRSLLLASVYFVRFSGFWRWPVQAVCCVD